MFLKDELIELSTIPDFILNILVFFPFFKFTRLDIKLH